MSPMILSPPHVLILQGQIIIYSLTFFIILVCKISSSYYRWDLLGTKVGYMEVFQSFSLVIKVLKMFPDLPT